MLQALRLKSKDLINSKTILKLVYLYAFLVSFEHILEYVFGIDTIFKPYRVVGILIILLTSLYHGSFLHHKNKNDKYLSAIVIYGGVLTITFYAIGESINLAGFYNDFLQIFFNLLLFLSVKKLELTYEQLDRILLFFTLGIMVNSIIMVANYYFIGSTLRESGFMDNPNSAAIAIIISFLYILKSIWKSGLRTFSLTTLIYVAILAIMALAVFASGSRSGVIFLFIGAILFVAVSVKASGILRILLVGSLLFFSYNLFTTLNTQTATNILNKVFESRFFYKLEQEEDDIRLYLWRGGLEAFKDSNFIGLGMGQFRSNTMYFKKYMSSLLPYYVRERIKESKAGLGLHSLYIELLVEGGIISLALLIIYFYLVFKFCLYRLKFSFNFDTHVFLFVTYIIVLLSSFVSRGMLGGLFWFAILICSRNYQESLKLNPQRILIKG